MSDVTGALHEHFGGKNYALRLSYGVIAKLQGLHGRDLKGLLTGETGAIPPFEVILDAVAFALEKGQGLETAAAQSLADDMLTADAGVFNRLMAAAFPDAVGNAPAVATTKRKAR